MAPTSNPFEVAARMRKSVALADTLDAAGIPSTDAASMTPAHWKLAAAAAGQRIPSPATTEMVIEMIRAREAARKRFAALPRHATAA